MTEEMNKEMTLEELEAHCRAELLPDRIEMRRRKKSRRDGVLNCRQVAVAVLGGVATNPDNTCFAVDTDIGGNRFSWSR